jgi:hypothetical protein
LLRSAAAAVLDRDVRDHAEALRHERDALIVGRSVGALSTIDVLIGNVPVGQPTYGFARADIDALFPGYTNSGGAVRYIIDTTTRLNGLTAQFLI